MIINGFEHIPKNKRKKILLLSDDLRLNSGVGTMSREIVVGTAHRFNWVQVGAAIQHPDFGKKIDVSVDVNREIGIDDAEVNIYPYNGYGNPDFIRLLLDQEKPDAILHYTDPRFWVWLYQMEHELRQRVPIFFYHVWDNLPYPKYNKSYYQSCDWIGCISKQTENIVRNVWNEFAPKPWQITYIPHGVDKNKFFPITEDDMGKMRDIGGGTLKNDYELLNQVKQDLFGENQPKFLVFYNNRNIRRKMTSDVILAFKTFVNTLPENDRNDCVLLMHTSPVDDNGTDLPAVVKAIAPDCRVVFSSQKIDHVYLNYLYNLSDVTINISSAEGFGLATLESLMAGTMILATVTGGLQDQMGFIDDNGDYIKFNTDFGSNHDETFQKCGDWAIPIFPKTRSLVGSPPTPYIFDDRVQWFEAAVKLTEIYEMGREERKSRGKAGREFVMKSEIGMEAGEMSKRFINDMEVAFENWKPCNRYHLYRV